MFLAPIDLLQIDIHRSPTRLRRWPIISSTDRRRRRLHQNLRRPIRTSDHLRTTTQ